MTMNYYTIEIEVTNYCNASCVFCANKDSKRKRGYINVNDYERFIIEQRNFKEQNKFATINPRKYPKVNLCGLGEPLLHPEIVELVMISKNNGFYTQLVTNGRMLTNDILSRLLAAGLDEIAISLHSVNEVKYNAITDLDVTKVMNNLSECSSLLRNSKIKVSLWRIKHTDSEFRDTDDDELQYRLFLEKMNLPNISVLGPSEPWDRAGYNTNIRCDYVKDYPYWCNKIPFTLNIDWEGNLVLCCNDYNEETVKMGNVFKKNFDMNNYLKQKNRIVNREIIPDICENCRRWADNEVLSIFKENRIDITDIISE